MVNQDYLDSAERFDKEWEKYCADIAEYNEEWIKKWPDHCKQCGGWGGGTFRQGHPYGSTTAYETLFDACGCTFEGKCPRCGKIGLTEEGDGPCSYCGWNYDDGIKEP